MNRFESDMYFRGKEIKSVEGKVREKYDSYIGVKYNNFTVIKILGTVDSDSVARVECVCGTVKLVSFSAIKRGTTRSCGCIKGIVCLRVLNNTRNSKSLYLKRLRLSMMVKLLKKLTML